MANGAVAGPSIGAWTMRYLTLNIPLKLLQLSLRSVNAGSVGCVEIECF